MEELEKEAQRRFHPYAEHSSPLPEALNCELERRVAAGQVHPGQPQGDLVLACWLRLCFGIVISILGPLQSGSGCLYRNQL